MTNALPRISDTEALFRKAQQLRRDVIDMVYRAGSGHAGGALGIADVLTVLYYRYFRADPKDPAAPDRDRFVLSNGHICPILYAILADLGYFERDLLATLRRLGSPLQGHPSIAHGLPGVDYSGGSLGNGLSFALGSALAANLTGHPYRVYCCVGDGDCQEGQTWEAAMAAAHFKAANLTVIVDYNRVQIDGRTEHVMDTGDLAGKWRAFDWNVIEIDGHDYDAITAAFEAAHAESTRPSVIVASTVIGKGVSFMEDDHKWHDGPVSAEQYPIAMKELGFGEIPAPSR